MPTVTDEDVSAYLKALHSNGHLPNYDAYRAALTDFLDRKLKEFQRIHRAKRNHQAEKT